MPATVTRDDEKLSQEEMLAPSPSKYRKYYLKNVEHLRAKAIERGLASRQRNTAYVNDYKRDRPCLHCGGVFHPCAMDFHHIDPDEKYSSVGRLVAQGRPIWRIDEEIAKCILICANCHRVLEHA